jgi:hypothetical protein
MAWCSLLRSGPGSRPSFRQTYCPPHLLGRVTASMSVPTYAVMPLGALLAGALGAGLGSRSALWILTIAIVLSGLILLCSPIGRLRDLPTHTYTGPAVDAGEA